MIGLMLIFVVFTQESDESGLMDHPIPCYLDKLFGGNECIEMLDS